MIRLLFELSSSKNYSGYNYNYLTRCEFKLSPLFGQAHEKKVHIETCFYNFCEKILCFLIIFLLQFLYKNEKAFKGESSLAPMGFFIKASVAVTNGEHERDGRPMESV